MAEQTISKSTVRQNGLEILMVSRDALFSRVAKAKLESWGHIPRVVEDCDEALQWFRRHPCRLVIVDFDLANGAGKQLCDQLRAAPRPSYVYLLCYGTPSEKECIIRALESGADGYIPKPLHPGELKLRLKHAQRLLALDDALSHGDGSDQATGLLSRATFERFYGVLHAQCLRHGGSGVLIFADIANLGAIGARHGLAAIHAVELGVALHINSVPRVSDFTARIDVGRFCLLLSNTTSQQCPVVATRLAKEFENFSVEFENHRLVPHLTLSMVDFPSASVTLNEAMELAPRHILVEVGGTGDGRSMSKAI